MPHHFIIYKPWGFLSQFVNNQTRRRNKKLLGELYPFPSGTMAIGRLDQKSEGLLLLTTDGKESARISSHKVEKEYHVQVDGIIDDQSLISIRNGLEIKVNGLVYKTKKCNARTLANPHRNIDTISHARDSRHGPTSWLSITLREGKFRQVRKMTAAVGFPTLRLVRVRIGNIILEDLGPQQVKEVDNFDGIE